MPGTLYFAQQAPATVVNPPAGYYAYFLSDGTSGTTAGVLYKKDNSGTLTALIPIAFTSEDAQDAVGSLFTDSTQVDFTYNDAGNIETARILSPVQTLITGANHTYTSSDIGKYFRRSNAGAAMADILPTLTSTDNGFSIKVLNLGTTIAETLTFTGAGGETIGETGATTYVLKYGCRQTFIWNGTGWSFDAGNGNLLKTSAAAPTAGDFVTYTDNQGVNTTPASTVTSSRISDFTEAAQDAIGILLATSTTITATYNDAGNTETLSVITTALDLATASARGLMAPSQFTKLSEQWVDAVADFGADPTGVADSTTAINNAVTSLTAGGRLFFPTGTYKVSSTITIAKPIIVCGQGRSITLISTTHATQDVFSLAAGAQGAGFEDIRIIGATTGLRTAGYGINLGTQANTYVRRVDMLYLWSGIHSSGALQDMDDLNILNGGANAANGQAVLIDSTGDRYIRRLITNQATSPTGYAAIRVRECSSLVISDSNLINSGHVLDIVPNAGAGHAVASVYAANTFFDTSVIGVNIVPASSSDTAQRMTFVRCWMSTMSTAGVVIGDGVIPNANINSLRFIGCEMYQGQYGINALGAGDWNATDCEIAGNTVAGINVAAGTGGGHSFTIANNFIGNGGGFGANAIGVTIGAGTYGHYQIIGNRGLDTNTTIGISDSGTVSDVNDKQVEDNPGAGLLRIPLAIPLAPPTFGGATTEVSLVSATIPANTLKAGTSLRFKVFCSATQTAAAITLTVRIRVGATTLTGNIAATTAASSPATARTNNSMEIEGVIVFRTVGATGTVIGGVEIDGNFWALRTLAATAAIVAAVAVDTTQARLVELTVQASAATLTGGVVQAASIEVIKG
jgi:Pectate lyase superfamily protein